VEDFSKNRSRPDGLSYQCRLCKRESDRRSRKTHPETQRRWDTGRPPEYRSWDGMKARCLNPKAVNYEGYGGRGISVCERWRTSFTNFLHDMGPRPVGTTLDRRDNDGNYEPGNCRWVTPTEQNANRRSRQRRAA
jgi:hypothetical protein